MSERLPIILKKNADRDNDIAYQWMKKADKNELRGMMQSDAGKWTEFGIATALDIGETIGNHLMQAWYIDEMVGLEESRMEHAGLMADKQILYAEKVGGIQVKLEKNRGKLAVQLAEIRAKVEKHAINKQTYENVKKVEIDRKFAYIGNRFYNHGRPARRT